MVREVMSEEQSEEWVLTQLKSDPRLTHTALVISAVNAMQVQLDRIEAKQDEFLAFRDLILTTTAPFLTGGKSKIWLALLAKGKGTDRT